MPSKSSSILLGVAVYAVFSLIIGFIAINGGQTAQYLVSALCCLAALLGPALTVWHYTSTNAVTVPAGTGAGLGAITILGGGLVNYVISRVLQMLDVYPTDAEMAERSRDQLIAQGLEPEAIESAMKMTEMMQGPIGVAATLVVLAVVGALAGAVAASVFKKGPVSDVGSA